MRKGILLAIVTLMVTGTTAMAATLDGRLGVTGKAGALVPLKDDFIHDTSETRTGLAAGGGLIFGVSRNLAVEVDVTHAPELDVEIGGSSAYEAALTDVALGVQYRVLSDNPVVPFFGLGLDFIRGNLKQSVTGASYKLDWTEGGHANLGVDFFVTNSIAFSIETRVLAGFEGDVKSGGTKVGKYDPLSFIGTVGIRLVLPRSAFY